MTGTEPHPWSIRGRGEWAAYLVAYALVLTPLFVVVTA